MRRRHSMPWSFKATMAMFVVFAAGAVLIGFACFESGWQALDWSEDCFFHHLCGNSADMAEDSICSRAPSRYCSWPVSFCLPWRRERATISPAGFRDASWVRRLRRIVSQSTSRGCCEGAAAVKANLRFRISIKLRM